MWFVWISVHCGFTLTSNTLSAIISTAVLGLGHQYCYWGKNCRRNIYNVSRSLLIVRLPLMWQLIQCFCHLSIIRNPLTDLKPPNLLLLLKQVFLEKAPRMIHQRGTQSSFFSSLNPIQIPLWIWLIGFVCALYFSLWNWCDHPY